MYGSYNQLLRYQENNRVIRIAKYGRCSSDEQKKSGYTIEDQLSLMDDFCNDYQLVSVGEYVDEGVSATLEISKRKALAKMIEDAKAGKFDIIIIKCIDRFFRSVEEYYACQKQLRQAGVTWISIEEPDLDPEDPDAAFKINIYLTMAEYEAKKTSKRIRFNNKMRIKNKQVITGSQCFLFPWIVTGEKRNRHLVKNKEKEEMTLDILDFFEKHQSKAATLGYINIKYGTKMTMRTLTSFLTDTLLYGEYKGVPDYVDAYITKERFERIQDILARNTRAHTDPGRVFLFSGMVKCPDCGKNLTGNFHKNGNYGVYNYRCNAARTQKICSFTGGISEKKLEKQLLDNLEQYITNEVIRVDSIEEDQPKNKNAEKAAKIKAEMDRLNMMFRKGRIEEEEYDTDYLKLEKQLKSLEIEVVPPKKDLDALKGILETDYRTIYSHLTKENKKAFWRRVIKEFAIDKHKKIVPESIIFF
jgi:DNA invertase Pin-like site-specific DNA recombinase/ssDNA-binding Zn-finger/Zn-ribbon topoisomerase 1